MISRLPFWNRLTIAAKLKLSFGVLFCLIVMIMFTWFFSLELEEQVEDEIILDREIESTVLDMDRRMEKARRLHRDFFLYYTRIGLAEAHVEYAQPSVRLIAQTVAMSSELKKKISNSEVSHTLKQRKVDLNLYLASAKRFADTSIQSIELITQLASPAHGLEARFEDLEALLFAGAEGVQKIEDRLQEIRTLYLQYKVSRQRHIMQSAFNVIYILRKDIEMPGGLSITEPLKLDEMLRTLKQLGDEILVTDYEIKQLFNDFSLQVQIVAPISQSLVEIAREDVLRANHKVVRTHRTTTYLLMILTGMALGFGVMVARIINSSVTRRITRLTDSAARMRRGHLDVSVAEAPGDELGQLGKTFNIMAGRIKELVNDLELKVDERTEQLAESERRFRQIASELPNIAVMGLNSSREVVFWNHACEKLYRYREAEVISARLEDLLCSNEDKDEFRGQLVNWIDHSLPMLPSEAVFHDRFGHLIQVFVSYVVVQPQGQPREYYSIHIDLADLKKAQEESALRYSIYRNLFDHTSSGVVVLEAIDNGEDFVIQDFNRSVERIEKLNREGVIGHRVSGVLASPALERGLEALRLVSQTGKPVHFGPVTYRAQNKGGWRQGHIYSIPTGQLVLVYDDVTREHEADLERAAMEARLQRAKKMEAIGMLAGGVAHDLNNILAGITGYPELLMLQLAPDSNLRKPLEAIHASGQRAAAVVADLLTVARGVASERRICALNPLVGDYLESPEYQNLSSHHPGIIVTTQLFQGLWHLYCSPIHLKKSLMNLITNAAEAIDGAGEIIISTRNERVAQGRAASLAVEAGHYVVMEVADSGTGITDEDIDHIFEPFYSRKVMDRSGTGLGLTVVWNTVQDHNGGVSVKSSSDGTTFALYFPAAADQSLTSESEGEEEMSSGAGETILVVDDEEYQRDIACQMLGKLGYNVLAVSSGEQAVQYLQGESVDLLLLDILMEPGINGCETYERVSQLHPGQRALVVSGYSEDQVVKKARSLGAGGFLQKPYAMKELARAVREILAA